MWVMIGFVLTYVALFFVALEIRLAQKRITVAIDRLTRLSQTHGGTRLDKPPPPTGSNGG
jgi:hypothetical protein